MANNKGLVADGEAEAPPVEWALAYARAGFAVVPVWPMLLPEDGAGCSCGKAAAGEVCDRPGKHPIPKQGVKQATTDAGRIRSWWEEHPRANVAIATGEVSGLILVDVDTDGEKAGDVAISEATAEHGGVPRTLQARSGSGGLHYYYRWRKNPFTRKIGFLKHVDYLSDGGYVIVQPSVNSKGPYKFDEGAGVEGPEDIGGLRGQMAELPEWFDKLEGFGKTGRKKAARQEGTRNPYRGANAAAMEFNRDDPRWVVEVQRALTFVDPDSRDLWVLFGIILGREFERNDDGWRLFDEWSARSAKYSDTNTQKYMRGYYYVDSLSNPQGGEPASIGTVFKHASDGGWALPPGGLDSRPTVLYRPGRAVETVGRILTLMSRERDTESDAARVFAFGSGLGEVCETHDHGVRYTAEGRPPNGWVLRMSPYTPGLLGSRVTHTATIIKLTAAGGTSQVECPPEVSQYMLANSGKNFPRMNGIVQWPIVLDGKVGGIEDDYDPKAGLLFALPDGLELETLNGTEKEARDAWKWLEEEALAEFPFGSERDRAATMAMLFTFVQRRAMDNAPAFLITAPVPGTGKTTLFKFASLAIHGHTVAASPLSSVEEEQRKTITANLMTNPASILFDNLQAGSTFDSKELAIAMTSGEWKDRKLGSTETMTLPNRAVWGFTGNNVTTTNDLKRRMLSIRLIPDSQSHYTKKFSRNLEVWALKHRKEMLRALTAVLLFCARAGKLELESESGFPLWDEEVRQVVVRMCGIDPFPVPGSTMKDAHARELLDAQEDPLEAAASALAEAWAVLIGGATHPVRDFMERVKEAEKSSDSGKRRVASAVESAISVIRDKSISKLEPLDWGHAIRTLQDRPLTLGKDGEVAAAFIHGGLRSKVAVWSLRGAEAVAKGLEDAF